MRLKHLFVVHSFIGLVNGGGCLLVPDWFLNLYGYKPADAAATLVGRLLGAGLLIYCLVAWFARNAGISEARRAIVLGFCFTLAIGAIVTLIGQIQGVGHDIIGWLAVVLYLGLASGYAYFIVRPDSA